MGTSVRRLPLAQLEKIRADMALLASADQKIAWQAVARLGRRRGQVVELLIEATTSPNSEVRHLALHALERIGDPRAYPVVLEMVHDSLPDNRWCALVALAKIGGVRAIPVLASVLRSPDADSAELQGAAEGLSTTGSAAIPALSDIVETGDSELRQRASWALRCIADEAVIEPLSRLLSDPDSITRWTGIESLSRLGQENPKLFGERCLALIEPLVNDPAEEVRKSAAFEMGELKAVLGAQS